MSVTLKWDSFEFSVWPSVRNLLSGWGVKPFHNRANCAISIFLTSVMRAVAFSLTLICHQGQPWPDLWFRLSHFHIPTCFPANSILHFFDLDMQAEVLQTTLPQRSGWAFREAPQRLLTRPTDAPLSLLVSTFFHTTLDCKSSSSLWMIFLWHTASNQLFSAAN